MNPDQQERNPEADRADFFEDKLRKTEEEVKRLREVLVRHYDIDCANCCGTGEFDHGSGRGFIKKCKPNDRNAVPHRFCPCESCKGTGIDADKRAYLVDLVGEAALEDK